MEFGIENIYMDKINIKNSYNFLKSSLSQHVAVNEEYNVTPVVSQITNFEKNGRTQSLITLSDATLSNSNYSNSRYSMNMCDYSSEKSLTNSISEFLKDIIENSYTNALILQPQVLYNSPKRCKRLRRKLTVRKRKYQKCTRLVRLRIVHFKYKHPERTIRKKLETYYDKTKRNCSHSRRIQQDLRSDSVLEAVSRTRIIKKVLSKANLLDEVDKPFLKDLLQDNIILDKDPSDDTLTRINSESSQNDSMGTKTAPSVVEIPIAISATDPTSTLTLIQTQSETSEILSEASNETTCINENNKEDSRNETIFKTDIISVAVAQINDASILKYKTGTSSEQSREEMLYKENLTSAESFNTLSDTAKITSSLAVAIPEKDSKNNHLMRNDDDKKFILLTDMVNTFENTSSDTFVIAKTSSYFKDNSDSLDISSDQTLTPSSELSNQTEPCNVCYQSTCNGEEIKSTLLDTILNVGMFQMPITSSENECSTGNSNNVIISDQLGKTPFPNKVQTTNKFSKNVIQKSFSIDNEGDRQKTFNLPNEDTIRSILTEKEKTEKKSCSEEMRNFLPPIEMWDKFILYFDVSFKRMEDSLVRKISNELKDSLSKFEQYFPFPSDERDYLAHHYNNNTNESDLSKMESGRLTHLDEDIQCGFVQNEELLSKMKVEGHTIIVEDFPLKLIKSRVKIRKNNDSFEVLKSPIRPCTSVGRGNGDSLLTLSSEDVTVKKLSKTQQQNRLVVCVTAPIHFFKANMLVITSVPAFFVSIFLVYRFFVLIM